jgi:hypothetical protein
MPEENESNLPAILIGLFVIVAVLIGDFAWITTKRLEKTKLAELEAREAELQAIEPLVADATFELQLAKSAQLLPGHTLTKINGNGSVECDLRFDRVRWQRVKFLLDEQSMKELIDLINALKIMNMENEYLGPGETEGIQWYLLIKGNGRVKFISCSNQFPQQIEQLADHVGKRINEALEKGVKAVPIEWKDHSKREKELWDSKK